MDLFDAIEKRHSYRGEFEETSVPREDLKRIVDAGIRAPSGCNAQTTSFVIVDDQEKLTAIADILDNPYTRTAQAMIVCVVEHRAVAGEMSFGAEDCAASVENMLLAITASGYATVWLDGVLRRDGIAGKIGALLDVPKELDLRVLLPIGIPKDNWHQRDRLQFKDRAWFNGWQTEG